MSNLNKTNKTVNPVYLNGNINASKSSNNLPNVNKEGSTQNINTNLNKSSDNISSFGLGKKGLRLSNLNVGQLQVYGPKFDDLKMLINQNKSKDIDIFGVCESWLKMNLMR